MHRSLKVRSGRLVRLLVAALLASTVVVVSDAGPAAAVEHPPSLIISWGTYGTGNGRFDGPAGVAVDPTTGDVYVTDTENHRVQKFDADGTFLAKWGSEGTGNGQFDYPEAVAVDPTTGDVYVADTRNHRVQKFDSDGTFLTGWGTIGFGDGQFVVPEGVAVDPTTGDVYVTTDGRVQPAEVALLTDHRRRRGRLDPRAVQRPLRPVDTPTRGGWPRPDRLHRHGADRRGRRTRV